MSKTIKVDITPRGVTLSEEDLENIRTSSVGRPIALNNIKGQIISVSRVGNKLIAEVQQEDNVILG